MLKSFIQQIEGSSFVNIVSKARNILALVLIISISFIKPCLAENNSNLRVSSFQKLEEFPILDLQDFFGLDLQKQNEFVDKLGQALGTYGFVLIINHGISETIINEAYNSAKDLFGLPLDHKKNYLNLQPNRGYKGYEPNRQDKKSDLQEYWHVGANLSIKRSKNLGVPGIPKNVWPKEIPAFRKNLTLLHREISKKSQPILEACSLYMGTDRNFLSELTHFGDSIMRVIHYLPNDTNEREWKAPHRDPNLLTVIVGVSTNGLELQLKDGKWIKVPFLPEAMIVSVSNMLESLSNGLLRSAPHRVVISETNVSRYSIPFFFHVQRDLSIAPQWQCLLKTGGEPIFPSQTAEEALKDHQWFQLSTQ